jgi:plastocyanin
VGLLAVLAAAVWFALLSVEPEAQATPVPASPVADPAVATAPVDTPAVTPPVARPPVVTPRLTTATDHDTTPVVNATPSVTVPAGATPAVTPPEATAPTAPPTPAELPALANAPVGDEPDAGWCTWAGRVANSVNPQTRVWLIPSWSNAEAHESQHLVATIQNRTSVPAQLTIHVGDWVAFENQDYEWHSVFSSSAGNTFECPVSNRGTMCERRFQRSGLVVIRCNRHGNERMTIIVGDARSTTIDADGGWQLQAPAVPSQLIVEGPGGMSATRDVRRCNAGEPILLREPRSQSRINDAGELYDLSNNQ